MHRYQTHKLKSIIQSNNDTVVTNELIVSMLSHLKTLEWFLF